MPRFLVMACLIVTASGCSASTTPTTAVFDVFGLECRTDSLESVVNDYGAVTGSTSAQEALAEFFEGEGRRFSGLDRLDEPEIDDLMYAFVDSDGLIQLRVQLTDEYRGYLVAGYSYCSDGG
jgi:hypothetical protein